MRGLTLLVLLLPACGDAPEPQRVLLITVDTLRADHVGREVAGELVTPFLDELAGASWSFERVVAPVPRTTPALASLHTGRYPHGSGVRTLVDSVADDAVPLAEVFRAHGFRTLAVVSNHILTPERRLDRGFELYDHRDDARDAAATTDAALAALGSVGPEESVFLWVHYIDPHMPYAPPAELARAFDPDYTGEYAERFGRTGDGENAFPEELPKPLAVYANPLSPEVTEHVRRLYAADVRATDAELRRLVEGVRERGPWLTVLTADHGESLGEHDFHWDHGDFAYDASLRVPLLLQLPETDPRSGSGELDAWVALADLSPTLLELAGLPEPAGARFEGRSLVRLLGGTGSREDVPVFAESGTAFFRFAVPSRPVFGVEGRFRAVYSGDWKLIWTPGAEGDAAWQLYDLARDPAEEVDLYAPDHPRVPELLAALEEWLARAATFEPGAASGEIGAEDARRLRELGYTGDD